MNKNTLKWVVGLTIPVVIIITGWIFKAGSYFTNIKQIPAISEKVTAHDKSIDLINNNLIWIAEGISNIEYKQTGRQRNLPVSLRKDRREAK